MCLLAGIIAMVKKKVTICQEGNLSCFVKIFIGVLWSTMKPSRISVVLGDNFQSLSKTRFSDVILRLRIFDTTLTT